MTNNPPATPDAHPASQCSPCDMPFEASQQYLDHIATISHPFSCQAHAVPLSNLADLPQHYLAKPHDFCQPCAMREEYRQLKPTQQICLKGNFWGCKMPGTEANDTEGTDKTAEVGRRIDRSDKTAKQASSIGSERETIHSQSGEVGGTTIKVEGDITSKKIDVSSAIEPVIEISLAPSATNPASSTARTAEKETNVIDLTGNDEDEKELVYSPSETEESSGEEDSDEESSDEEECMPNEGWELIDESVEEDELGSHGQSLGYLIGTDNAHSVL